MKNHGTNESPPGSKRCENIKGNVLKREEQDIGGLKEKLKKSCRDDDSCGTKPFKTRGRVGDVQTSMGGGRRQLIHV